LKPKKVEDLSPQGRIRLVNKISGVLGVLAAARTRENVAANTLDEAAANYKRTLDDYATAHANLRSTLSASPANGATDEDRSMAILALNGDYAKIEDAARALNNARAERGTAVSQVRKAMEEYDALIAELAKITPAPQAGSVSMEVAIETAAEASVSL